MAKCELTAKSMLIVMIYDFVTKHQSESFTFKCMMQLCDHMTALSTQLMLYLCGHG